MNSRDVLQKMDTREWLSDELARRCGISQDEVVQHLRELKREGLVRSDTIHHGNQKIQAFRAMA